MSSSSSNLQDDRIFPYLRCGDGADATEANVERAGMEAELGVAVAPGGSETEGPSDRF